MAAGQNEQSRKETPAGKVCFILDSLDMGGVERVMINLANEFAAKDFEVDMVVVKNGGVFAAKLASNIRIVNFKLNRVLCSLIPLARYFRKEKPTAAISARDHLNVVASVALWLAHVKTKLILTMHNLRQLDSISGVPKHKVLTSNILSKCIYSASPTIVAVSKAVARDQAEFNGLSAGKIKVIYNPVITPHIFSLAGQGKEAVAKIAGGKPLIVSVGRLAKEKDYATLIRAFSHVLPEFPSRLVILGEGPERENLQKLICKLGLKDSIILCGYTDNPYVFIKNAEVFVLSSITESLSAVVVEALALGTKVVATDCGGVREVLQDGRLGLLSPVGDEKKLAQAVLDTIHRSFVVPEEDLQFYTSEFAFQEYIKLIR